MTAPHIIKSTGESEEFSEHKLRLSLERAGVDDKTREAIIAHIRKELREGMTTREIYRHAFSLLKKRFKSASVRYSLRKAVAALGPEGFAFERLVGEVLRAQGYKVQIGGILQGECVEHEVDVLGEKDTEHIFVECKFHNQDGIKTDLKVALYVQARHEDLQKYHLRTAKEAGRTPRVHDGWLVTNTKLTTKAIEYSQCAGLVVIGWDYPRKGNLQDLILAAKLHPLTCLETLSASQKRHLLTHEDAVVCQDIVSRPEMLRSAGMDQKKVDRVLEEINNL